MVSSNGKDVFKELKRNGHFKSFGELFELNLEHLERMLKEEYGSGAMETIEHNDLLEVKYLIQEEAGFKMGLCVYYKIWRNRKGWQHRCNPNPDEGHGVQVSCFGNQDDPVCRYKQKL